MTKSLAGFKSDSRFENDNIIEITPMAIFQGKNIPENLNLLKIDVDRFEDVTTFKDCMFVYKTKTNWGIKVDDVKNINADIVFASDFLQNDFKLADFKNNATSLETNLFPQKLQLHIMRMYQVFDMIFLLVDCSRWKSITLYCKNLSLKIFILFLN